MVSLNSSVSLFKPHSVYITDSGVLKSPSTNVLGLIHDNFISSSAGFMELCIPVFNVYIKIVIMSS